MIIAMDGPAGTGKSTIARMIAENYGFIYVNSGSFYRAITLASFDSGINPEDTQAIIEILPKIQLGFSNHALHLNGRNVEKLLHSDRIDLYVAQISAIPEVREKVNQGLREYAKDHNLVMEGRDITTVVFPDADLKVYIDASPEARARRRFNQGTSELGFEEIKAGIEKRDVIDRNKKVGALKIAEDAWYLDTSDLTIDAVYAKISAKIQQLQARPERHRQYQV